MVVPVRSQLFLMVWTGFGEATKDGKAARIRKNLGHAYPIPKAENG